MADITTTTNDKGKITSKVIAERNIHYIEVVRNAKGDYQWSIKLYFGDDDFEEGAEETIDKMIKIDDKLKEHFL